MLEKLIIVRLMTNSNLGPATIVSAGATSPIGQASGPPPMAYDATPEAPMGLADARRPTWVSRLADGILLLAGLAMIAVWLTIAVAHIRDRYSLNHVSGDWIAVAYYAKNGTFYPPLYRDGYYGGTRYGAIPILLHGGGYRLSGDPIASGKMLGLAGLGLMLAGIAGLLRRVGASAGLAAIACALLLATGIGWKAGTSINCDALAVGIQLLALICALGRPGARRGRLGPALAGLLCALAFFTKLNAIWATLAIFLYLALNDRRALVPFLGSGIVGGLGLLGLFQALSEGRMLENFSALMFAGESVSSFSKIKALVGAAKGFSYSMQQGAGQVWFLAPVSLGAVALAVRDRRPTLIQLSLLVCVPLTLVILTNPGIAWNHMIDVSVLLTLCAAEFAVRIRQAPSTHPEGPAIERQPSLPAGLSLYAYLALTFFWLSSSTFQVSGHVDEFREAARMLAGRSAASDPDLAPDSWRAAIAPGDSVLSCDASIPVLMGQRPVVVGSFMLKPLFNINTEARDALIARLDRREFDWVVSVTDLRGEWGGPKPLGETHWGFPVIDAIERNYEYRGKLWEYYSLYGRKAAADPDGSPPDG